MVNPVFQNALALDLLSWDIISREKFETILLDPWEEAEKVEKSNSTRTDPSVDQKVLEDRVHYWEKEYIASDSRVARRWPHTVYPPLPFLPRPPLTPPRGPA